MSDFMKNYNNPLMQAVQFSYKGNRYGIYGYWAIFALDEFGNEYDIDDGKLNTKSEALEFKAFDNGTKSLKDIINEISNVEFDF